MRKLRIVTLSILKLRHRFFVLVVINIHKNYKVRECFLWCEFIMEGCQQNNFFCLNFVLKLKKCGLCETYFLKGELLFNTSKALL